jgi:hypothetical protein
MSKKANKAEAAALELIEAMLRELEVLRQQGGEAYPPRLRQLAALAAGEAADEQVQKAVGKKAFTTKAVVTEKVDRKPSLDSPVYFKGDEPKKKPAPKKPAVKKPKDDGSELAGRMLVVLEAQRRLGAEAYPPTLRRLAELCELNASDTRVTKAADRKAMADRAVVAAKAKGKPVLDAPVVLKEDLEGEITTALPGLLRYALAAVTSVVKEKPVESTAFTLAEVGKRLVPELQKPVLGALERGIERRELPEDVAWIIASGKPYLFLVENMRPGAARPSRPALDGPLAPSHHADGAPAAPARQARDFAGAFRKTFEQIDRRNGAKNFVKLAELRRELAAFGRDEFDSGLRALREGGEFSLDSHEGLHGSLTPEDREAAVREAGSVLVYVSRR